MPLDLTYKPFSADGHLEVAPERWSGHVPEHYRERAPRRITLADGGDGVVVENRELYVLGLAVTGKPFEQHVQTGVTYADGAGAGNPERRLREQDQDGLSGEVLFSGVSGPGMWRSIVEDEVYKSIVHAYNEWLAEEYCAANPERLVSMGVIPNSDIDGAVEELEYCARAGLKGVQLSNFPSGKGRPSSEDDRFWERAIDFGMPLTAHVSFVGRQGPTFDYPRRPNVGGRFGSDPLRILIRSGPRENTLAPLQLTLAGVFDRFPELTMYLAETMAGWLPAAFEQLDDTYDRSRHWIERDFGLSKLARPPSEYLLEHFLWGFVRDNHAVAYRHEIGVDKLMWGSDFPHAATNWPHSLSVIGEMFENVPEAEAWSMLVGNVIKFFHLSTAT